MTGPLQFEELPSEIICLVSRHLDLHERLELSTCSKRTRAVMCGPNSQARLWGDVKRTLYRDVEGEQMYLKPFFPREPNWNEMERTLRCGVHMRSVFPGSIIIVRMHCYTFKQPQHFAMLGVADILDLRDCQHITSTAWFGSVSELCLLGSWHISDVSTLGRLVTLDLSFCERLTDVSALKHIPDLSLKGCRRLADISGLAHGGVRRLNLAYCNLVTDVSPVSYVHSLDLQDCTGIRDISCLTGVHSLNVAGMADFNGLDRLRQNLHVLRVSAQNKSHVQIAKNMLNEADDGGNASLRYLEAVRVHWTPFLRAHFSMQCECAHGHPLNNRVSFDFQSTRPDAKSDNPTEVQRQHPMNGIYGVEDTRFLTSAIHCL
eukprot:Clim_evm20s148 gene=Clim_evmTU20s148